MNRAARALLTVVVASLATVGLATAASAGYRPAPDLDPVPLNPAPPTQAISTHRIERVDVGVPIGSHLRPGWLFRPVGLAAAPSIVLIPGAGPHGRDDLAGDARALAGAGVAALVTDKRADGYGPMRRDFDRLAADAAESARWLARQPGIDPVRVGLMGWSEGGWIAPLAAVQEPEAIAYVVLASAPVVSPLEQVGHLIERTTRGAPSWLHRTVATMMAGGPNVVGYVGTDIRPQLAALGQPVLAVWGADDKTVPVNEAIRRLGATVPGARISVLSGRGHTFAVDDSWLGDLVGWIDSPSAGATGVQPASMVGVPTGPAARWFTNPILHLGLSLIIAALAAIFPRRTRRPPRPSQPRSLTP